MSARSMLLTAVVTASLLAVPVIAQEGSHNADEQRVWDYELTVPRPDRPDKAPVAHLWLPEGVETIRGLIIGDSIRHGGTVCRDPHVR
ncbi:MAG: hypothetical protein ACP5HU_01620, partial [Phycisphaerae bacterium]